MPRGSVTDLGDGKRFNAIVDYDEPGPWPFMTGPEFVGAQEAVAWARRHTESVLVQVGDVSYSAGREPLAGLPEWSAGDDPVERQPHDLGEPVEWRAEARTGWFRADAVEVARRLAYAVRSEPQGREVAYESTESGFRVTFTVDAPSIVAARETASKVLRNAWKATEIEATPGDDYDVPSLTVRTYLGRG